MSRGRMTNGGALLAIVRDLAWSLRADLVEFTRARGSAEHERQVSATFTHGRCVGLTDQETGEVIDAWWEASQERAPLMPWDEVRAAVVRRALRAGEWRP